MRQAPEPATTRPGPIAWPGSAGTAVGASHRGGGPRPVGGGLVAAAARTAGLPGASTLALGRNITSALLNVYAMRMAAVFTLTTVTIARRTAFVSRWITMAGLATAAVLLVGIGISQWVELLLPAWVLALSIDILVAGPGSAGRPITPAG